MMGNDYERLAEGVQDVIDLIGSLDVMDSEDQDLIDQAEALLEQVKAQAEKKA
jgi:hypothetical protein